jgi:hypothetical protein
MQTPLLAYAKAMFDTPVVLVAPPENLQYLVQDRREGDSRQRGVPIRPQDSITFC